MDGADVHLCRAAGGAFLPGPIFVRAGLCLDPLDPCFSAASQKRHRGPPAPPRRRPGGLERGPAVLLRQRLLPVLHAAGRGAVRAADDPPPQPAEALSAPGWQAGAQLPGRSAAGAGPGGRPVAAHHPVLAARQQRHERGRLAYAGANLPRLHLQRFNPPRCVQRPAGAGGVLRLHRPDAFPGAGAAAAGLVEKTAPAVGLFYPPAAAGGGLDQHPAHAVGRPVPGCAPVRPVPPPAAHLAVRQLCADHTGRAGAGYIMEAVRGCQPGGSC